MSRITDINIQNDERVLKYFLNYYKLITAIWLASKLNVVIRGKILIFIDKNVKKLSKHTSFQTCTSWFDLKTYSFTSSPINGDGHEYV